MPVLMLKYTCAGEIKAQLFASLISKPSPFLPSVCCHNHARKQKSIEKPLPCIIVNAKLQKDIRMDKAMKL